MQHWYARALEEDFRDEPHEEEMLRTGHVLEDYRAAPSADFSRV